MLHHHVRNNDVANVTKSILLNYIRMIIIYVVRTILLQLKFEIRLRLFDIAVLLIHKQYLRNSLC